MNEDDDIFGNDAQDEKDSEDAESGGAEEETIEKTPEEEAPEENTEQASGETPESEETPEEEPISYTIAQLAQAHSAKGTQTKSDKIKSPKISVFQKEELDENAANMPEGQLAIDVYETPAEIIVRSTIAGAKPEDLDIGIEENTVNIRGARHNEERVKGENYLYQECYWGTFSRSIILPTEVDGDKAEASLKDGVLTITLPKIKKERERKIKVIS